MNILDSRVSIVGPGRAAQAFARSWVLSGGRLRDVIARERSSASRAVELIGDGRPCGEDFGPFACDLLVVGVPDDAIRQVARRLAPNVSCPVAFHLSGALPAQELAPLAPGTSLGSLHPVRAFSGVPGESWRGAFVAIEGDEEAVGKANLIVEAIGARGLSIAASQKALYHAAATLAAGGCVAVVSLAARLWAELGIPDTATRAALSDLAARAVGTISGQGFEDSLTGPVARRDLGTVRAHKDALAGHPEALAVYTALAREVLARTPGRGQEEEILSVLEGRG